MKTFISDLDNTIIYSYKKDIGKNKILVEKDKEKELTFMSEYSYKKLKNINDKYNFIPLTTRSLQQYRRIKFFREIKVKRALVANGGILLEDDKIVEEWFEESLKLVEKSLEEIKKAEKILLRRNNLFYNIRFVNKLFIFSKSDNVKKAIEILKEKLDLSLVDIENRNKKIYIFPKELNKGRQVERLKKYYNLEKIIVAGDSEIDVSMLEKGDISIFPQNLKAYIKKSKNNYSIENKNIIFSDEVLYLVEKFFMDQLEEE